MCVVCQTGSRATRKRNACCCVVVYDSERALYLKFGESDTRFHTSWCCLFGFEHDYAAALVQQSTFCKSSADRKDTQQTAAFIFVSALLFFSPSLFHFIHCSCTSIVSLLFPLLHVFVRVSSSFCKPDTIIATTTTFTR